MSNDGGNEWMRRMNGGHQRPSMPAYQQNQYHWQNFNTPPNHQMAVYQEELPTAADWIPEFVGQYRITNLGKLAREEHVSARNANLKAMEIAVNYTNGAPSYVLKKDMYYIAVLVLRTYVRYENRYEIPFHRDGNINNCRLDNLEWRHYKNTDDKHRREYAVKWKKDCDDVNYVPNPRAGKRFKNGEEVKEEPVHVNPKPQPPVIKPVREKKTYRERTTVPTKQGIGSILVTNAGRVSRITVGSKPKALPYLPETSSEPESKPDVVEEIEEATVVEIITKDGSVIKPDDNETFHD